MISIDQAATKYGVIVQQPQDAAFRVAGFILSHEHMPAILLFRVQEPGGQGVAGLRVRVRNGGDKVTFYTNEDGYCDMAVGGGSYYFPGDSESGPHSAELYGESGDVVHGLGMFGETDHQSLITVWERAGGGDSDMGDIEYDLPPGWDMYTHFRQAGVERRPGPGYHVTKLTAVGVPRKRDDKVLTVTFRAADGSPAPGVRVRVATYGRAGPGYLSDEDGQIFLEMGEDWYYAVPGEPPKAIIPVAGGKEAGDTVVVGVVMGRWDWLNIDYQWSGDEDELPGKPTFHKLEVGATSFSVSVQCEGASGIGYTLDGPEYHRAGEVALGESGVVLRSDMLDPLTTYALKAWGTYGAGDGPDAYRTFETLAEGPPPVPEDWDMAINTAITRLEDVIETLETLKVERDGRE